MGDIGGGEGRVVGKRKVLMNEYFPRKETQTREKHKKIEPCKKEKEKENGLEN